MLIRATMAKNTVKVSASWKKRVKLEYNRLKQQKKFRHLVTIQLILCPTCKSFNFALLTANPVFIRSLDIDLIFKIRDLKFKYQDPNVFSSNVVVLKIRIINELVIVDKYLKNLQVGKF